MGKNLKILLWILLFVITFSSNTTSAAEEQIEYKWLIEPKYKMSTGGISDGLWCVCDKNRRWGYVDSADNVVLDFQYVDARAFKNGVAFVRTSNKFEWGLIDKKGQYLIKPQSGIDPFSLYFEEDGVSGLVKFSSNGLYGFMDLSGQIRIPAVYKQAFDFSEGLAAVKKDDLVGFIDTKGNWAIPPSFVGAWPFEGDYAPFRSEDGLWGLIDKKGNVVLKAEYEELRLNDKALTGVRVNGKWGFMDDTFQWVVEAKYNGFTGTSEAYYYGGLVFMQDKEAGKGIAFDERGNVAFTFSTDIMVPKETLGQTEEYYIMKDPPPPADYFRKPLPKEPRKELGEFLVDKQGNVVFSPYPDINALSPFNDEGLMKVCKFDNGILYGLILLTNVNN